LSERGENLYRVRRRNQKTSIQDNVLYAVWKPWSNVEVHTWIVAGLPWHVRIHRIETKRALDIAEGGFALGVETELTEWIEGERTGGAEAGRIAAGAASPVGASGVQSLLGFESAELIRPNANTNVLYPRTVLPTLLASLEPGVH